jgi:hypothetical protein
METNMNIKMNALMQIYKLSQTLAETERWLMACPFDDADAIFETAHTTQVRLMESIEAFAEVHGDEAILETIRGVLHEDEWSEQYEDNHAAFWLVLAEMANERIVR